MPASTRKSMPKGNRSKGKKQSRSKKGLGKPQPPQKNDKDNKENNKPSLRVMIVWCFRHRRRCGTFLELNHDLTTPLAWMTINYSPGGQVMHEGNIYLVETTDPEDYDGTLVRFNDLGIAGNTLMRRCVAFIVFWNRILVGN